MQRVPAPLTVHRRALTGSLRWLWAAMLTVGVLIGEARAQQTPQPSLCAPVEDELAAARLELEKATTALRAAEARAAGAEAMRHELERAARALEESEAAARACVAVRDDLCTATRRFAKGIGAGQVDTTGLTECLDPADRHAVVERLSGWSNASSMLGDFVAYASGDSDRAPSLGPSTGSTIEKRFTRLFATGNGTPLVFRRLLIEAMAQVAPRALATLKARPGSLDRWFASEAPLDDAIVQEAHEGAAGKADGLPRGALAKALGLVDAYRILARCDGPSPARACHRAGQLARMLESSGPLIVRRRMQDVWASECSSLTDTVVHGWLTDLPKAEPSEAQVEALVQTIHSKLLTCFLRNSAAGQSFSAWLATKLPAPQDLTASTLSRLVELERLWEPGSPTDRCARAVRTLQTLPAPSECSAPSALVASIDDWASATPEGEVSFEFGVCDRLARALWRGENANIPDRFPAPPTLEDAVRLTPGAPPSNVQRLRTFCRDRVGRGEAFVSALRTLGRLGRALGESPALPPWNLDTTTLAPIELGRIGRSEQASVWLRSLIDEDAACSVFELTSQRCRVCRERSDGSLYDCALLQSVRATWARRTQAWLLSLSLLVGFGGVFLWGARLRRASRANGAWRAQAIGILRGIGLRTRPDRLRILFPSRFGRLDVELPENPAWERWGRRAVLVRSHGASLQERDVNRAGTAARARGAELAFLLHDDAASPELGAVRAMLEWAARGAGRGVHVLSLPWSRLQWARAATDLLELAEESSLRTNPFEVRGRITSSTQFFNRERLVSGLLAGVQAGRFVVVTGLRRFGKSSLALEVARRLPGPSAYADLTGFHHELGLSSDPAAAADAILRYLCLRLIESAQGRSPGVPLPVTVPEGSMDAATLAVWFRDFGRVLARTERGRPPPMLLILDELEQAIGAAKELSHALDVFAIVVGRLKNCLPEASSDGQRVGVLFCSALHPLLWSPLATLAHQSLIASFEYVAVACLADDVAGQMMRGLGSRQGIRFTDAALELLVRESQGVPLLLRRLGTVVLELYDPERARQGSLGAVEIGVEGVRAALERAESEGSPLRVWVESEIAEPTSPGGAVLRTLAAGGVESARELRRIAARVFRHQFDVTGVALTLSPGEADRRAEEAAGVVVRTLGESGVLRAHGDPTEPDGYELPDGVIRRILQSGGV